MNETPRQYLDKKRPIKEEEGLEQAERLLEQPLGVVSYGERGSVAVERDPYKISFDYEKSDDAKNDIEKEELKETTIYQLKKLAFERSDTGASLKLDELAPGFSIFFIIDDKDVSSYVALENERIVLVGDPVKPRTILTLLHEIGHIYERPLPKRFDETQAHADLAEKFHSERAAWAYALKKLRPFLHEDSDNPFNKQHVLSYAKQRALNSYAEWVDGELQHHAHMDHYARTMFPEQFEEYPEENE